MLRPPGVRQTLFVNRTRQSGERLDFVFLDDGQCGITRDGVIVETWIADDVGIEAALLRFRELCDCVPMAHCPAHADIAITTAESA